MLETSFGPAPSNSFWSRTWRFLCAFDEALHTTDTELLATRVDRLERQFMELKVQNANPLAAKGDQP